MEPESLVSVPLLVEDRVVAALNVYRIGVDKSFSDAEVAQVERFATMAALAFDSARQRDTLREQARTDGLTGLLNHRACHERLGEELARAAAAGGRSASSSSTSTTSRPSTTPTATPRATRCSSPRPRSSAPPCARTTSSRGWAARSSR